MAALMKAWPVLALLLLAPLAAAQVPAPPDVGVAGGTVRVAWAWTPAEVRAPQGSLVDMVATATFTLTDAVCPQGATLKATATLVPEPDSVALRTDPLGIEAVVGVPTGAYGGAVPAHEASVQVPFQLLVDLDAAPQEYRLVLASSVAPAEGCAGPPGGSGAEGEGEPAISVRVTPSNAVLDFHPPHEDHGAAAFDFFLQPGASRSYQYNATGHFSYHDHFNPELKGEVEVEEQGPMSAQVQVSAQGFNPALVRIGRGGNVTWTNADSVAHTISADELHPEHLDGGEAHGEEPMEQEPAGGGNATAQPDSGPPARNAPGLEALAVAAGVAGAALLHHGRARRR